MNLRRVFTLFTKETRTGSSNFFFIFAVVMPVALSIVVTLAFGSLFSEQARLGVVDLGESALNEGIADFDFIVERSYRSEAALREAVADGAVDMGLVIPADFDTALVAEAMPELQLLIWGESRASDRALVTAGITRLVTEQGGGENLLTVNTVNLSDDDALPIEERMLPLLVLISVILGGTLIPASSLVDDKVKHTLRAIVTTPTTFAEAFLAKGLLGFVVGWFIGIVILVLNNAFGTQPVLLVGVLGLGAAFSAAFGILLGIFVKDTNSLFATMKMIGVLLYAPALIYLFPDIPQAAAQVFPTYYMIAPVIEITQNGAGLSDILPELAGLVLMIGLMVAGIGYLCGQIERRELIRA